MKIGIVQTRGLGDVVIAVPLAMWYADRGCEVLWPIDSEFIASFAFAFRHSGSSAATRDSLRLRPRCAAVEE
jgi:hypothetical protein